MNLFIFHLKMHFNSIHEHEKNWKTSCYGAFYIKRTNFYSIESICASYFNKISVMSTKKDRWTFSENWTTTCAWKWNCAANTEHCKNSSKLEDDIKQQTLHYEAKSAKNVFQNIG